MILPKTKIKPGYETAEKIRQGMKNPNVFPFLLKLT
jgi:hypothetical protein